MNEAAKIRLQTGGALAIGFAGLMIYAFPGYMSSDSAAQLVDARSHAFTDGHPPAMAALWSVVELLIKGPAGMLILQAGLFLLGTFGILRRVLPDRAAAIVASAILLLPPVVSPMAVIWKDSQMAGFLLLGTAFLLEPRRSRQVVAVVLLTVAAALRDNGGAATLPLLVLFFRWRPDYRWFVHVAISVGIWVASVGTALTANKLLTRVEQHAWYRSVGPADIIGVLKQSRTYSDAELIEVLDGTPLIQRENIQPHARTHYNPTSWWSYMNGPLRVFNWPENADHRKAISRAWWQLVSDNPGAYLLHRLRVFRAVLGLTDQPVFDPAWHVHVDLSRFPSDNPYAEATGVQAAIARALMWVAHETPLFRPSVYLFAALAMLIMAWRHRDALALLLSGLAYELSLFPFAPSTDYRYSHWMVTATIIGAVLVFLRRRGRCVSRS